MKAITSTSIFLGLLCSLPLSVKAAGGGRLTFEGLSLPAIAIETEASTGLDMLYVCYDTTNSSVKFPTSNPQTKWYCYSNLGGAYAEEISDGISYEDGFSVLSEPPVDMGYIIEDGDSRSYFWIVGYKDKRLVLRSAQAAPDQDCDFSIIEVEGSGNPIHYFTINGQQKTLSRDIEVTYETLTFDEERLQYIQGEIMTTLESLTSQIRLTPPAYCQTVFHISGDRFLKDWNWLQEIETETILPHAVAVHTTAEQEGVTSGSDIPSAERPGRKRSKKVSRADEEKDDPIENLGQGEENGDSSQENETPGSNIITNGSTGLGGSAPAEISFRAYVTDGVLHNEWQMSSNPDFDPIDYRFTQQDLDYTFTEEGTFYLRFVGSNSDGSCEAYGDDYEVTIGSSELRIPNAFSPNGDGVNDEWKVAYRSLTKFECWIFDRYGKEICHLTDPTQGWDGKIGGKDAKPGVYYYVIEAVGADGKKYKKSGDINILRYVGGTKTESPEQ